MVRPARYQCVFALVSHSLLVATTALRLESGLAHSAASGAVTIPNYDLNDGYKMPALGLGVYRVSPGKTTYETVKAALELGYRMIDTAHYYGNEADVGRAVRDSGIPRSEIFVTSKLWDGDHGCAKAYAGGVASNKKLGLDYIDLYLIHTPGVFGRGKIVETYDALLQLKADGVVRSVGVSNFNIQHLEALKEHGRPTPALNQIELHPLVWEDRKELVQYCKDNGILVQAYGSILSGHWNLMDKADDLVEPHGKTPAQILLRWALDQGFQVIPKSTHKSRQAENMDVFDFSLSDAEIETLNKELPGGHLWDYLDLPTKVSIGNLDSTCKQEGS